MKDKYDTYIICLKIGNGIHARKIHRYMFCSLNN
jgi:hypothetical protein